MHQGIDQSACARCGAHYQSARDICYSEEGDKICRNCFELGDLEGADQKYTRRIRASAYLTPVIAVTAILCSIVVGSFVIAIVLLGVATFMASGLMLGLVRDDELRTRLDNHLVPVLVSIVTGLLMSGGCLALALLSVGFMALR